MRVLPGGRGAGPLPNPGSDAELIAGDWKASGRSASRFQLDVGQADFFRGILQDLGSERPRRAAHSASTGRISAPGRTRRRPGRPCGRGELLLPTGPLRQATFLGAGRLVRTPFQAALANLAEVYRLLTVYGLADSVLLDLGQ
jgi:hypothetical protein